MLRAPIAALFLCACCLLPACKKAGEPSGAADTAQAAKAPSYATLPPDEPHRVAIYHARGQILRIAQDHRHVIIAHQEIVGFMQAMTMAFAVRDAGLLKGLKAGDEVEFTLETTSEGTVVTAISKAHS